MPSASEDRTASAAVREETREDVDPCALDAIRRGASTESWAEVVDVFWEAFGWKLQRAPLVRGHPERGRALAAAAIDPQSAYVALDDGGRVLGVVFVAPVGRILDPDPDAVGAAFGGAFGVIARAWAKRKHERIARHGAAVGGAVAFEGFAVRPECRGAGVGSALLERVVADARAERRSSIELTVGDTNEGARRLYERHGFVQTKSTWLGPLVSGAGFARLLTYERRL